MASFSVSRGRAPRSTIGMYGERKTNARCPCTPPSTVETFGEEISADDCSGSHNVAIKLCDRPAAQEQIFIKLKEMLLEVIVRAPVQERGGGGQDGSPSQGGNVGRRRPLLHFAPPGFTETIVKLISQLIVATKDSPYPRLHHADFTAIVELPEGRHEYKFFVDGQWLHDPKEEDPNLLVEPNHVILNHLYALSIKDNVLVLAATHRFQQKYITTLVYKPI